MNESALVGKLCAIVGPAHVLTGGDVGVRTRHFWDPAALQALALVRPASTDEVSQILQLCHRMGQPVVTHGGVTGLVEGDRSTSTDVILSLERMRAIEAVDPVGRTLTVQAGCVLEAAQDAARQAGLQFCLDLGARGSCTIGGNLSTNAGGLSVLRYGMMREQVLGLEAVLADGTVISSMNHLMKNNTGYDLKQLFIGSEGTLGVVTRAVLRLRADTPSVQTALVAFESFDQVTAMLTHADRALAGRLNAFEIIWQAFYRLNTVKPGPAGSSEREGRVNAPLNRDYPVYAIIEARGNDTEADARSFESMMESAFEREILVDAVIAKSDQERQTIWWIRENVDRAGSPGDVFVYDVSLPIMHMDAYRQGIELTLEHHWPGTRLFAYGHIADGNIHLQVALPEGTVSDGTRAELHAASNALVYRPLQALNGSVSAEHGIGLTKKPYLELCRTSTEIALMRTLKNTLDPNQILNPGKIL